MRPPRVLFPCSGATDFSELLPLARFLRDEKGWRVHFHPVNANAATLVAKAGAEGFASHCSLDADPPDTSRRSKRSLFAPARFAGRLMAPLVSYCYETILESRVRAAHRLETLDVDAVVTYDDRGFGDSLVLCHAAVQRGLPVLVLPIAVAPPAFRAANRLRRGEAFCADQYLLGPVLTRLFPHQIFFHEGRMQFFYLPHQLIALRLAGMLPPLPWSTGGGFNTHVLAQSDSVRVQMMREGIPEERIVVTGQFSHDALYRTAAKASFRRQDLLRRLGFDDSQPLAIIAVPQLAEHKLMDWASHWREIQYLLDCLEGCQCLLSLHPKMNRDAYLFLEQRPKVRLADERLGDILPCGDLFIAAFESTIHWSLLVGTPALFLDYFGLGYDLSAFPTVRCVNNRAALRDEVRDALVCPPDRKTLRADGAALGILDGNCGERIHRTLMDAVRQIDPCDKGGATGESPAKESE